MVQCPECENDLDLDEDLVEEGDVVSCVECGTDFEVVTADPLVLAAVGEEAGDDEDAEVEKDDDEE